ncbi:MAG: NAD(P)-binding protein [Candidatus Micrarchaeia archaeon]
MKIRIAGAGPAGSVAALSASMKGHSVEVFEEHGSAGYPQHCSGLVSREGLESLSDMLDYKPFAVNHISTALFDFAGEEFEIRRKSAAAIVINRAEFDSALASEAESEGVRFMYSRTFSPERDSAGVDAIIGADGALSRTALHFGFPKIRTFAFTLKAVAKMRCEEASKVTLFYDNRLFPGFFGWLIPHGENEAEIGAGTTEPACLRGAWEAIVKKTGAPGPGKPAGKIIPLERRARIAGAFGGANVLLAGDAAGQVKSSSGGGVVFGSAGARLAGALAGNPAMYEKIFAEQNSADMAAHAFLRSFFAAQPGISLRMMSRISNFIGLNRLFASRGSMDRPTRVFSGGRD